ncbi:MAG: helix-turn-helix domain-containing protein [Planctomycetota bacterium]|nr:helix-turn-helix domain-containing protein [Planctomycetota bacterium]
MKSQTFRKMIFRPNAAPSPGIPLGARSVGHYRITPSDIERPAVKHFVQLFWGVEGRGAFILGGEERVLNPGEVAVYMPGMEHNLRAIDDIWEYRWWTMDGPLAADVTRGFGFGADIYRAGPAPHALFERLARAIGDLSRRGERRAGAIAYRLLSEAAPGGSPGPEGPAVAQVLRAIHRHVGDPSFGVERMAAMLDIHRSTLSRMFKDAIGVPPSEYLARLRLQNALSLLKCTALPVAEIARRCGFDDPNYFSRLLRRKTGMSPRMFREK